MSEPEDKTTPPAETATDGTSQPAAVSEEAEGAGVVPPAGAPPAARPRSTLVAVVLSFVWPGLGHLYARKRVAALVFALPVLAILLWGAIFFMSDPSFWGGPDLYFVFIFGDPSFAMAVAVIAVLVGAWRIGAVIHAYTSAASRRRPRAVDFGTMAVLIAAILFTHVFVAGNAWAAYDADNNVNIAPPIADATPSALSTASPFGPSASSGAATPGGSATPFPTPVSATPAPNDRITFLITGVDSLPGRDHALNDSLMVISLNTATHKVSMVSVPRDTSGFDLYYGGKVGNKTKINMLFTLVSQHKIQSPDDPITTLTKEIGYLMGVHIDYFAMMDMSGFSQMIDTVHGVCVYNSRAIRDPSTHTYIGSGTQCLDGATALKYVRSREAGGSDYLRARRQQDVLLALEAKVISPSGLTNLNRLITLAGKSIWTNFPTKNAKNYVSIVRQIGSGDISRCVLAPPYSFHPDSKTTGGTWTSRLKMYNVASLSWEYYGEDSRYYNMAGIWPRPCGG
jgi:LCP family protein required for cell wall assembly